MALSIAGDGEEADRAGIEAVSWGGGISGEREVPGIMEGGRQPEDRREASESREAGGLCRVPENDS